MVHASLWAIHFYEPKDAQLLFFNLNNDLYTVNLNILTISGWNAATSIDLSQFTFTAQSGANLIQ